MPHGLTRRQTEVLHFVEDYFEENQGSPTLQEICDHFGFKSPSSAQDHLRLIEKKGYLTKKARSSRSIRVVNRDPEIDPSQIVSIPLVGNIAAGAPSFALEHIEEVLTLPKSLFSGPRHFALRVRGDSMINAGIFDGDIAVLKSQQTFQNGDIAAVVVDEEATLKRVFRLPNALRLHPENDAYDDKIIPADQVEKSCRIAGVLEGTIRQF